MRSALTRVQNMSFQQHFSIKLGYTQVAWGHSGDCKIIKVWKYKCHSQLYPIVKSTVLRLPFPYLFAHRGKVSKTKGPKHPPIINVETVPNCLGLSRCFVPESQVASHPSHPGHLLPGWGSCRKPDRQLGAFSHPQPSPRLPHCHHYPFLQQSCHQGLFCLVVSSSSGE